MAKIVTMPHEEQKRNLVQLISAKLAKMTVEELREMYNTSTRIMDNRKKQPGYLD